jgi:hypothetical protein
MEHGVLKVLYMVISSEKYYLCINILDISISPRQKTVPKKKTTTARM